MTTYDVLKQMLSLAADAGVPITPGDLFDTSRQAGTITAPRRDYPDTTPWQAAACDLVIREANLGFTYATHGATPYEIAYRLRMVAWVASRIMPTTLIDLFDRYSLTYDDDGTIPTADQIENFLAIAVTALKGYIAERDNGQWIDPHVLSGAVADIHDAARMIVAAHQIHGTDETHTRHSPGCHCKRHGDLR